MISAAIFLVAVTALAASVVPNSGGKVSDNETQYQCKELPKTISGLCADYFGRETWHGRFPNARGLDMDDSIEEFFHFFALLYQDNYCSHMLHNLLCFLSTISRCALLSAPVLRWRRAVDCARRQWELACPTHACSTVKSSRTTKTTNSRTISTAQASRRQDWIIIPMAAQFTTILLCIVHHLRRNTLTALPHVSCTNYSDYLIIKEGGSASYPNTFFTWIPIPMQPFMLISIHPLGAGCTRWWRAQVLWIFVWF